jgi:hypothetical protein
VGLELNGTHQLVVVVYDLILLEGNIHTMKKNTAAVIVARKEVGVEVNKERKLSLF